MPTKEQVLEILNMVLVPGVLRSPVEMNLVRNVSITDHRVDIRLVQTRLAL